MKLNRMFSIEVSIVEKLSREQNKSKLVNELLKEYYAKMENPAYLEKQLKVAEIMQEAQKKAEVILHESP